MCLDVGKGHLVKLQNASLNKFKTPAEPDPEQLVLPLTTAMLRALTVAMLRARGLGETQRSLSTSMIPPFFDKTNGFPWFG